jgi:predicted nucleotidyltransferase
LKALWVFGSYARGEATEDSDIDMLIDFAGSPARNMPGFLDVATELEQKFNKDIDILLLNSLTGPDPYTRSKYVKIVTKNKVLLYKKSKY